MNRKHYSEYWTQFSQTQLEAWFEDAEKFRLSVGRFIGKICNRYPVHFRKVDRFVVVGNIVDTWVYIIDTQRKEIRKHNC